MKTGRMALVIGQLTDGALTPSDGVCARANVCTDTRNTQTCQKV